VVDDAGDDLGLFLGQEVGENVIMLLHKMLLCIRGSSRPRQRRPPVPP
jgi:hypothetical protein